MSETTSNKIVYEIHPFDDHLFVRICRFRGAGTLVAVEPNESALGYTTNILCGDAANDLVLPFCLEVASGLSEMWPGKLLVNLVVSHEDLANKQLLEESIECFSDMIKSKQLLAHSKLTSE